MLINCRKKKKKIYVTSRISTWEYPVTQIFELAKPSMNCNHFKIKRVIKRKNNFNQWNRNK